MVVRRCLPSLRQSGTYAAPGLGRARSLKKNLFLSSGQIFFSSHSAPGAPVQEPRLQPPFYLAAIGRRASRAARMGRFGVPAAHNKVGATP